MVDIDLLDKYMDEHCIEKTEREEKSMPRTRKEEFLRKAPSVL